MLPAQPLRQAAELGRRAAGAGLSGLVVTEAGRTAYLTCGALAVAADIDVLTGIAVAFPRSPMVTAATAWELAEASGGRFRLGLGAQVRAHVQRRYGSEFDPPGPRLREYVIAVKAIFESFREGAPLAVEGEFYNLSLLPPTWSPGPIDCPNPPVDVAAVNPWMLRMAAEEADGVHVHPLNTPTYLEETVLPNLEKGAARSGRSVDDLEVIVPAFLVVGDTDVERRGWRERARMQVAFYGSTPNYAFIFEQLDREGTTDLIRERQRAGDIPGMAAVIDDDLLKHFVTEGSWDDIAATIVAKYDGIATRVVSYFTGADVVADADEFERWGTLARQVVALSSKLAPSRAAAESPAVALPAASAPPACRLLGLDAPQVFGMAPEPSAPSARSNRSRAAPPPRRCRGRRRQGVLGRCGTVRGRRGPDRSVAPGCSGSAATRALSIAPPIHWDPPQFARESRCGVGGAVERRFAAVARAEQRRQKSILNLLFGTRTRERGRTCGGDAAEGRNEAAQHNRRLRGRRGADAR